MPFLKQGGLFLFSEYIVCVKSGVKTKIKMTGVFTGLTYGKSKVKEVRVKYLSYRLGT